MITNNTYKLDIRFYEREYDQKAYMIFFSLEFPVILINMCMNGNNIVDSHMNL